MKRTRHGKGYKVEDLVVAAYSAAREATSDHLLATIVATRVLEDWLVKSGRMDLAVQIRSALL
jgi:hypothetical protein